MNARNVSVKMRRALSALRPGAAICRAPVVCRVSAVGTVLAVRLAVVAMPAVVSLLAGADAGATTDTTFAAPLTTVTNMVGGTGGQLAAVLAVGAALVGSVLRFNATQIMGAVGVGVAAGAGAGVVTSIVGTAIV